MNASRQGAIIPRLKEARGWYGRRGGGSAGAGSPGGAKTSIAYTPNQKSVTEPDSPGITHNYIMDALDRLSSVVEDPGSFGSKCQPCCRFGPESGTIAYDDNGNVTQRTDARGTVTANTYNLFGSYLGTRGRTGSSPPPQR